MFSYEAEESTEELHAKLKRQKKVEKRNKAKSRDADIKRALELGEEVGPSLYLILLLLYRVWCILVIDLMILRVGDVAAGEEGSSHHREHEGIWRDYLQTRRWRGTWFCSNLCSVIAKFVLLV